MTKFPQGESPEPGSFYNTQQEKSGTPELDPYALPSEANTETENKERSPEVHPDLVAKYKVFADALHPKLDVIYHPSNATDVSPSAAFPGSRVIYVEIDKKNVDALTKTGYESHYASATESVKGHPEIPVYVPDAPVDVLILLNPAISSKIPSQYVREGGYVLANDYHTNATELYHDQHFEIVGIIRGDRKTNSCILDTDHPEDYWKEIETEEEFKNAPFSWGGVDYQMARNAVGVLTGKTDNILEEYKKLLMEQKEKAKRDYEHTLTHMDEGFAKYLENLKFFRGADTPMTEDEQREVRKEYEKIVRDSMDPFRQEDFIVNHEGRTIVLSSGLPRKKGVADDYFVFRKKEAAKQV